MKVLPTMEGGLCILPESEADWEELELICSDAVRPSHLAESLADLMDEQSEWDEYVVPDLEENFQSQTRFVNAAIENARKSQEAVVFISPAQAEKWYGALNQARLSLHARYDVEEMNETAHLDEMEPEPRSAYFRNRFYLLLQSMLLEFVLNREA
jgi:hypothetical protein